MILGPGKKKKDDIVGSLFKAARDAGQSDYFRVADPHSFNPDPDPAS